MTKNFITGIIEGTVDVIIVHREKNRSYFLKVDNEELIFKNSTDVSTNLPSIFKLTKLKTTIRLSFDKKKLIPIIDTDTDKLKFESNTIQGNNELTFFNKYSSDLFLTTNVQYELRSKVNPGNIITIGDYDSFYFYPINSFVSINGKCEIFNDLGRLINFEISYNSDNNSLLLYTRKDICQVKQHMSTNHLNNCSGQNYGKCSNARICIHNGKQFTCDLRDKNFISRIYAFFGII